jgi:hypothetical protein
MQKKNVDAELTGLNGPTLELSAIQCGVHQIQHQFIMVAS